MILNRKGGMRGGRSLESGQGHRPAVRQSVKWEPTFGALVRVTSLKNPQVTKVEWAATGLIFSPRDI